MYNIARHNPKWCVLIIGHTYTWEFKNCPSNVIRIGTVDYNKLSFYYNQLDVGIIPFLNNQIGNGADPIKLYEYFSCGIPVVTRNLSFCNNLEEPLCYKYNTESECIEQITKAMNENNDENTDKRKNYANQNTWEIKLDNLLKELEILTYLEV